LGQRTFPFEASRSDALKCAPHSGHSNSTASSLCPSMVVDLQLRTVAAGVPTARRDVLDADGCAAATRLNVDEYGYSLFSAAPSRRPSSFIFSCRPLREIFRRR